MYANGFRVYFTPLPGFFSPFPHGTSSLSVSKEYLALDDGPPIFNQDFSCPGLLASSHYNALSCTGLSPFIALLPNRFHFCVITINDWALPISLAATLGISVYFFSFGYLDVSVPRVRLPHLCIQCEIRVSRLVGFPIQISPGINACLTTPRRFSQSTTSFFASYCLGIHRLHLFT